MELDNEIPEYGSLVHEYWKRFYAERFRAKGYKVEFEVPRKSGRVDVVAVKSKEKIAIEIETGKSDFIRNVKQNLATKYNRIIVVATDKKAFEKIKQGFAKVGLLGINRINFVLRNMFSYI